MSEQHLIAIADFVTDDLAIEREVLGDLGSIQALNARDEAELAGRIEDVDAIMMYHCMSLTRQTIERLTRCKIIVRCGVGYDNVDWAFARERGIAVANVPDYGTEEVADSAIGMTLMMTRGIHYLHDRVRAGKGPWLYSQVAPLYRLRGRGFGIVGLGRIGTAAALRAKALGMDVVFYDPYKPDGADKMLGVRRTETLDELLAQSYVVSMHCPLTDETHHMIGAAQIDMMQRGSYVVNTARGGVVDVRAIPDALANGQLAGAAIDVLEQEPPDNDDPLVQAWRDPNHAAHHRLILNPHSAFYCEEGFVEIRRKAAEACRRALLGEPLRNVVN